MAKGKSKKEKKRFIIFISVVLVLGITIAGLNLIMLKSLILMDELAEQIEKGE